MSSIVDVAALARAARIALSEDERVELQGDLEQVLEFVGKIDEVDTSGCEATTFVCDSRSVLRPDVVRESLEREVVLANAPGKVGSEFKLPKIVEEA